MAPPVDDVVERKDREGRWEILFFFASFAASAFKRDVRQCEGSRVS
jgi:hypothetical protein